LTPATKHVEVRTVGKGERKRVIATCALGAIQVGYVAEQVGRQGGNPLDFHKLKWIRDGAEGFWPKVRELCDQYELQYGTTIELDNDTFGRDFVHKRIEGLR
jgi:hypothetical protein